MFLLPGKFLCRRMFKRILIHKQIRRIYLCICLHRDLVFHQIKCGNAAIVSNKIRIFFIPQFHDLVLIILRIFCRKLLKPFLDKSGVFDRFIIILYIGMCEYLLCLSALLTIELTHFSFPHCNISATEYNLSFL